MKKILTLSALTGALVLTGCANYTAPAPAELTEECIEGVLFTEDARNDEKLPEFRTCLHGVTKSSPPTKLLEQLNQAAAKHCLTEGRFYKLLRHRIAPPNKQHTARTEIIFTCTVDANGSSATLSAESDPELAPVPLKASGASSASAEIPAVLPKESGWGLFGGREPTPQRITRMGVYVARDLHNAVVSGALLSGWDVCAENSRIFLVTREHLRNPLALRIFSSDYGYVIELDPTRTAIGLRKGPADHYMAALDKNIRRFYTESYGNGEAMPVERCKR